MRPSRAAWALIALAALAAHPCGGEVGVAETATAEDGAARNGILGARAAVYRGAAILVGAEEVPQQEDAVQRRTGGRREKEKEKEKADVR